MALDSHKLLIEDFASINSTAENLFRVLPSVHREQEPESKEEGERLAKYATDIADKVAKRVEAELKPKLAELEKENEACQDKLNDLYSKLKAYNSSFRIKAGSSLRIKPERMVRNCSWKKRSLTYPMHYG